jgi:hypothetical protein
MTDNWADAALRAAADGVAGPEGIEAAGAVTTVTRFKVLPDGGELVYGEHIVEVGDRGVPEHLLYRHSGDAHRPALEVAIEVVDGIPVITRVTVFADPEQGVHIKAKDIKIGTVDLDGSLVYWLSELTYRRAVAPFPDGRRPWYRYSQVPADERRAAMRTIAAARQPLRRRLTDELLAQVAEAHRVALPPKHETIATVFQTSPRSAQRWIAEARRRGLIDA